MDFDCLTRKELQFLCKRNKIPANITNVAMADALKALEIVEGLDDFKNQSPEKTMTSTRRKPSKEENQAMQSTIRTRKTARKVSDTPVTARRALKAELEIKDETPLQSCRGGTGVASRRKAEAQKETSLQTGYNTRRSVRLLGKSMTGLSLKENDKVEPVKDDEMVEGEVGNNNDQSELPLVRNLNSSLEDEREKNDDVEEERECNNEKNDEPVGIVDSKGSDAIAVTEDAHETENLKPVADETHAIVVAEDAHETENLKPVADESDAIAVTEDAHETENLKPLADETDAIAVTEDAHETGNLKPVADEADAIAVTEDAHETENLKPVADENDAIAITEDVHETENLKPVADETHVIAVTEDAHETENLKPVADETRAIAVTEDAHETENLKPVADETRAIAVTEDANKTENLKPVADEIDDVAVSQEGYEIKNLEDEMVVDKSTEVLVVNAEASADMEVIDAVSVEENANQAPQEIECQKSHGEDCEFDAVDDNLTPLPKAEELADDQVSQNVSVLPEGHMDSSAEKRIEETSDDAFLDDDSDFDDDTGSDSESFVDDDEDDTENEESYEDEDDSEFDDDTGSDSNSLADAQEEVSSKAPITMVDKEALVGDDEDDTENEESDEDDDALLGDSEISNEDPNVTEALVDALVGDDEVDTENEESDVDDNAFLGDSDTGKEDPNVTEAAIDVCVKPAEEESGETAAAKSEITTTSVSSMSSPLKAQLSEPMKSSSSQVLENINKENINNNTAKKELDLGLKKVKKNKNLEDLSIRHLKKLLSKLEIADKNKEDDTLNKVPTLDPNNTVAEFHEE